MTMTPAVLTGQQLTDLDVARCLAAAGVPVFVAHADPAGIGHNGTGFWLPEKWQQTAPDPAVVDQWRPGMALCAVMGHGLDLIDVDPRNGGELASLNGSTPHSYGHAVTPSGGVHSFVRSLGVGSRDNILPGIDVKGGQADGSGRGFAFLAPTVRPSKVTGELAPYRWVQPPDVALLAAQGRSDRSGDALAARIRALKADSGVTKVGGPDWWQEFALSREPQSAPAAERAIAEKLRAVAEWQPAAGIGFRDVLLAAAFTLGGYVGGGYLDEDEARGRLREAVAQVWGGPDADDELWIEQGLTDGRAQPFYVYTAADELAFSEAAQASGAGGAKPPWTVYSAVGTAPFDPHADGTDQGLAEAVAARMHPALRYGVDSGRWLVRGCEVWAEREDMGAWAVSQVARLMPLGDTPVPKDVTQRTPEHWQAVRRARFMDSGGAGKVERKLRAIVRNSDHPAGIEVGRLDADPEVLWAGGLPYDLRASRDEPVLAPIDPATPHLHTAEVAPRLVPTPAWDRFVSAVWPDDELRSWALRVLAVTLAGYPDAVLPVLYGPERTGKTSLVQLIVRVLGTYGHAADPRLLAGADNAHASVVYALKGRRLSFIDEGPRRGHLASERLKQLTGGGSLTGNAMRANPVTFDPTHTLVMTTNDEPPVTDPALRARMRIIPCEANQGDVRAARRAITATVWAEEAPGVLARLMAECAAWLDNPDTASTASAPALVRGVVDDMAAAQSPVREWVELCTVPAHPGTQARELYRCFLAWHEGQPMYRRATPPSETAFGRALTEMGHHVIPDQGPRRNQRFRPLSVLTGGGWPAPWAPTSPGGAAGLPDGLPTVPDGSAPQPSGGENPRSTQVFSSSSDSSDSSFRTTDNRNNNTHTTTPEGGQVEGCIETYAGNRRERSDPRRSADKNSASPAATPVPDGLTRQSGTSGQGHEAVTTSDKSADPPGSSQRVTNSDVARRADEQKVSKAEARAALKEEKRQAAIREAQGEVLPLPAAVDRAGNVLPVTLDQAEAVMRAALARSGELTLDVETSGHPVGHRHYQLRSVQLGDAVAAVVLDPTEHAELIRAMLAEAPRLRAHSATADLVPCAHAGLIGDVEDAWARMHDTVIPAKLADPASTGSDPGLKQLAGAVLREHAVAPAAEAGRKAVFKAGKWLENTKTDTPVERSGWAQIATGSTAMLRYAAADVLDTAALAQTLPMPEAAVSERERLAQRMTARITHRGVPIDWGHVQALSGPHRTARAEAAGKIRALGIDNPGSPVQIGRALLDAGAQLPTSERSGRPSVTEDVLAKLAADETNERAAELACLALEYRSHDKALGTYLDPYRLLCELGDGRARPTIYTLAADTGRMSSVRPNFQNIPREGGFRASVTSDPGHLMIGADFSGVEIRVAAALSQDPTLLRFLAEGRDLHAEIALQVFGADPELTAEKGAPTPRKAHRYACKGIVFGRMYGGGIPTLAKQAGVSEAIAQAAVDTLDELTPQLTAWSGQIKTAVQAGHTQFRSYSGRVIHLPRERPHAAPNFCIQGTARELLIDALVRWSDTRWGTATLLPVHDELDAWVPAEDAEEATAELVRCMKTELLGVPIVATPEKPSTYWRDST